MAAVASPVAPSVIRWHISDTETLPCHFGFHEKKPLSFEHATIHRKSITRLEQHFFLLRQLGDTPAIDKDSLPTVKPAAAEEHKYEKREDKLTDELTAGGGVGAVEDGAMYEKGLVEQAATEAPHESLIASNKTLGGENATYDNIDEPVTVAAVDQHILSPHTAAKHDSHSNSAAALLPPKDDILNLPAKDETMDLSNAELVVNSAGVPVVMPVAEPLEPTVIETVKQAEHPEIVEQEEREEEERAAAQGALASGSLAPIEETLLTSALRSQEVPEVETSTVQMPVAEPVGTVTSSTLHAPHPSLDDSQLITETLATEAATTSETTTLDELRQQHENEAAAAKEETERLDSTEISPEERETAELQLMTRTKRLAALHERIIRHQTLQAQGPDITAIKTSPALPATAISSKIMEIQQQHLTQQAESAVTHTAVEKSAATAATQRSRTKELARQHEQKIVEEAEAKKQQDELFAGKAKSPTGGAGRGRRGGRRR